MPNYLNMRSSATSDPIRNFRFLAKFYPVGSDTLDTTFNLNVGFMSIQGLAMQTEAIPYREGGFNTTVHFLPGQQSFSPVTFQRGVVLGSTQSWEWFRRLYDPGTDAEQPTGAFRCQIEIGVLRYPVHGNRNIQQGATANKALTFTLMNAWPTTIAYSDLNAADNAVIVEQMTVVHEGFRPDFHADAASLKIDSANGAMTS